MTIDMQSNVDFTNKDYASLREAMLELAAERMPEWTDRSPNDLGVMLVELFAYMGDILFHYQDRIANESYLETAVERSSVINLLRLIGYELRPPTPASADLTLLFADDGTGTVTIDTGTAFQTTAKATGEPVGFQYLRDPLDIPLDDLPVVTHTDLKQYKRYATLPVLQVDATVANEILGSSDGSSGQRFRAARAPVIEDYLEVRVDEGAGPVLWTRRDSLLSSLAGDRHYLVRREENDVAVVEFGDGRHGKVPRRGRNNVTAAYRIGGGGKGNVPPFTITKAVTSVDQLKLVINESAATGGADAESSSEAVTRGPQLFRAQERAVTAADFEAHAKAFGVGKARARAANWNHIDLYVAPVGGGQPTDTLKEDLRAYFEDRRIMTSILDIRDPDYVNVCISGTLEIDAYHFADQVQQRVANAIRELLAFENVTFQHTLYLSKVYEAIEAVDGVQQVVVDRLAKRGATAALPPKGKLVFLWNEIPRAEPVAWEPDAATGGWAWQTWKLGTPC